MTEQGKVHYLLVRGYEEFHDEATGNLPAQREGG